MSSATAVEQHFTAAELAKRWHLSIPTVRRLFQERADVIKIGSSINRNKRRSYVSIRIPSSVAELVYSEMLHSK